MREETFVAPRAAWQTAQLLREAVSETEAIYGRSSEVRGWWDVPPLREALRRLEGWSLAGRDYLREVPRPGWGEQEWYDFLAAPALPTLTAGG